MPLPVQKNGAFPSNLQYDGSFELFETEKRNCHATLRTLPGVGKLLHEN